MNGNKLHLLLRVNWYYLTIKSAKEFSDIFNFFVEGGGGLNMLIESKVFDFKHFLTRVLKQLGRNEET